MQNLQSVLLFTLCKRNANPDILWSNAPSLSINSCAPSTASPKSSQHLLFLSIQQIPFVPCLHCIRKDKKIMKDKKVKMNSNTVDGCHARWKLCWCARQQLSFNTSVAMFYAFRCWADACRGQLHWFNCTSNTRFAFFDSIHCEKEKSKSIDGEKMSMSRCTVVVINCVDLISLLQCLQLWIYLFSLLLCSPPSFYCIREDQNQWKMKRYTWKHVLLKVAMQDDICHDLVDCIATGVDGWNKFLGRWTEALMWFIALAQVLHFPKCVNVCCLSSCARRNDIDRTYLNESLVKLCWNCSIDTNIASFAAFPLIDALHCCGQLQWFNCTINTIVALFAAFHCVQEGMQTRLLWSIYWHKYSISMQNDKCVYVVDFIVQEGMQVIDTNAGCGWLHCDWYWWEEINLCMMNKMH